MIDVCVEIETNCKNCGNPLMLNALSDKILCQSCQKYADFPYESWKSMILESPLTDFSEINEGEGQAQTNMTGEYTFRMKYGRQQPRCRKCKTNIDLAKIDEYANAGFAKCSNCPEEISVRKVPAEISALFDTVKYLIGEDRNLIGAGKNEEIQNTSKPVLFTCPSCAGNLEIDGKERTVTCKYCGSEIYLPDDLWLKLHPVKTVTRWYLLLDEEVLKKMLPEWDHLSGVAVDSIGNAYFLTVKHDNNMIVWCMGNDFKTKWLAEIGKYDGESTGLALSSDEALYIYDRNKHELLKLLCKDGSKAENLFNKILDCSDMSVDTDGSLLCLINDNIVRFSPDGNPLPVWSTSEDGFMDNVSGFFHSLVKSDTDPSPDVYELKNKPDKIDSENNFVSVGLDGFIYFMAKDDNVSDTIAKYDKGGEKLWSSHIPLEYKYCKAHIDSNGNIFALGDSGDDKKGMVKFNAAGNKWEILLKDIKEGGVLNEEDYFAVSNNGMIYIADSYDCLKVFDSGLKKIFITKQSKEDDEAAAGDSKDSAVDDN